MDMRSGNHQFTQYRQMLISRGANRLPRVISIPTARDRIALRSLTNVLLEVFPEAKGSIPQRRIEEVRRALQAGVWNSYIKVDISDFFPSICHDRLESELRSRIRKPEILKLITAAITTPTVADRSPRSRKLESQGVPQGLSISSPLAEISAAPVDRHFLGLPNLAYFRFVDDILILCNTVDLPSIKQEITGLLNEAGLTAHSFEPSGSKSHAGPLIDGFEYLGYRFEGSTISVRASSVRSVESSLAKVFTQLERETEKAPGNSSRMIDAQSQFIWRLNLIISGCVYDGAARGWVQYFRQMNDLTLLKRLDVTVGKFLVRFNAPDSLAPKSFLRTYWNLRHPRSRSTYIPDFDNFSLSRRLEYVALFLGRSKANALSDSELQAEFHRIVGEEVARLERDIGALS